MKVSGINILLLLLAWSLVGGARGALAHLPQAYVEGDVLITFKPGADLAAGTLPHGAVNAEAATRWHLTRQGRA